MTAITPMQKQALVNLFNKIVSTDSSVSREHRIKMTVEEYIKYVRTQYNKNVEAIKNNKGADDDFVRVPMLEAEEIWMNVQILAKSDQYEKMTDDERISLIQRDFKDFYKNFPIVSRYMICLCEYSAKAFRKMLIKCKNTKIPTEYLDKKGKGKDDGSKPVDRKDINEKLWIERQADYIRFLWEENQETFEKKESDEVWKTAYNSLTKEFEDFKRMHEQAEKKIKEEEIKHKKELLYEMSNRIITGTQKLSNDDAKELVAKLKSRLYKQKYKKVMGELTTTKQQVEPIVIAQGTNEEEEIAYKKDLEYSSYKKNFRKMDITQLMA